MDFDPVSNSFVKEEELDNEEVNCNNESKEDQHVNILVTPKGESYFDVKNDFTGTFEPVKTDDVANVVVTTCLDKEEKYSNADNFEAIGTWPESMAVQGVQTGSELGLPASLPMQCEPTTLPESKNKSYAKKRQQNRKKVVGKRTSKTLPNKKPKQPDDSKCFLCDTPTENERAIFDHLREKHSWCKFCQKYCFNVEARNLHMVDYHKKREKEILLLLKNSGKSREGKYCDFCGRHWKDPHSLKKHMIEFHKVVYTQFVTGNGIVQHV